jgi:hypothetical protein
VIAEAQQPKIFRVGVITSGGAWYQTIDGLRVGLRELGLEEGKQFVFAIRDTKGDLKQRRKQRRISNKRKLT